MELLLYRLSKSAYKQVIARTENGELQVIKIAVLKFASANEPITDGDKKKY